MKKVLSIIMAATLIMGLLTGCGSSSKNTDSKTADTTGAAKITQSAAGKTETTSKDGYKIGINCFGSSSYALLTLANNSKAVFKVYGDETSVSDDNYQVDKIVQDIENMIATGVDGLVVWLPADSLYETVAKICEKNKVPFVLNDKIPSDEKIAEEIKSNPYFAGAVSPANAVYGEQIAKYALDKGYKSCIISSSSVGDPSDGPRLEAFKKAFQAGGGTIADELHADTADAAPSQIEDSLIAHPDVDFIYGTGSDFGIAACGVLKNQSNTKIKVLTSGLDSEALKLLQSGQLELLSGDNWISGIMSAIVLENYIDGNALKDANGNVPYINDIQPFTLESNQIDLFRKCFIDNFCYTDDEINNMRTKINASFNYDAFINSVNNFSFEERAKALCKAGVVTQDELTKAGISVN